jgi:hypothetical protein
MAGEIVEGKRTMITRVGHANFELPNGHEITPVRDRRGAVESVTLRWGDHRSVFFATADEEDDVVVVHLRGLVGSTGYMRGELPYRFPDD